MRFGLGLAGCATLALLTTACSDGEGHVRQTITGDTPVRVAGRLDCPEREGDLRLQSIAADGRACAYRTRDGAEVELRLASASELPGLESELKALVPTAESPEPPSPPTPPGPMADEEAGRFAIPGVIDVRGERERASVRLPGVRIEADGDKADVRIGGDGAEEVFVRAHDGGAVVRLAEGERGGALHSTFLVTSETAGPSGLRLAGYQARGTQSGSLVVGVIRGRGEQDDGLMDDVGDLVDRNVRD